MKYQIVKDCFDDIHCYLQVPKVRFSYMDYLIENKYISCIESVNIDNLLETAKAVIEKHSIKYFIVPTIDTKWRFFDGVTNYVYENFKDKLDAADIVDIGTLFSHYIVTGGNTRLRYEDHILPYLNDTFVEWLIENNNNLFELFSVDVTQSEYKDYFEKFFNVTDDTIPDIPNKSTEDRLDIRKRIISESFQNVGNILDEYVYDHDRLCALLRDRSPKHL